MCTDSLNGLRGSTRRWINWSIWLPHVVRDSNRIVTALNDDLNSLPKRRTDRTSARNSHGGWISRCGLSLLRGLSFASDVVRAKFALTWKDTAVLLKIDLSQQLIDDCHDFDARFYSLRSCIIYREPENAKPPFALRTRRYSLFSPKSGNLYLYIQIAVRVCMFPAVWHSQFFTDLAHFWHARPLGQQEGHRLCKVALRGCFETKIKVKYCISFIGHR